MIFKHIPPFSIILVCTQIWLYCYFYFLFQHYLMISMYLTAIAVILIAFGLHYLVFEPVDEKLAQRVLFKENSSEHPIFAHRGGAHDAPENTVIAIREAVAIVSEMFSKHKELYEHALVASFFPSFIYQLRRVDPKIVTALTWRPRFISYEDIPNGRPRSSSAWKTQLALAADAVLDWAFHNVLWYMCGVSAVLVHKDCLSA
ncbi:glycerophosphodiester phosphodiesterase 1-like [Uloborus diversus]|uniref:glycerophosphodiester phosphodiesterase 1-like n=1 Tax=Uloborus diversus TaxID=327109 RepID=UPI00240994E3|nr:glycerophosphodiester phosphodiesterase 1-like [Uloborus diversus]